MSPADTTNRAVIAAPTTFANRVLRPLRSTPPNSERCDEPERETKRGLPPSRVPPVVRAAQADSSPLERARAVVERPGNLLDPAAATILSAAFRHDFTHVRVHSDATAAESARALGADAYTLGRHVVFGRGRYGPRRPSGLRLLAHELAHTLQGPETLPRDAPLELSPTTSSSEHSARTAARHALAGTTPAALTRSAAALVHRAESGTYVSTVGPKDYLDAGAAFYQSWGYPNVKRVATLDDVLTDLDRTRGAIEKFRLVSHGLGFGLEIGLLRDVRPGLVDAAGVGITSEGAFRKELVAGPKILDDATYGTLVGVLQKDTVALPLMTTLGAAATVPTTDSELGILLRAILETYYVANVQLPGGGSPVIANRGVLDSYNQQRVAAYTAAVIRAAPQAQQTATAKAIAQLRATVGGALTRANRTFTLAQSDADTLADPFTDPAHAGRLSSQISTEIAEGAGTGPFLPRLRRVQARITDKTLIEVRGCTIGTDLPFMDALRAFFGAPGRLPMLTAPDLYQYFFRLNYETFTADPRDEAKLRTEFDDPGTGLAAGQRTAGLVRARQLIVVANENTLDEVARRYGTSPAATLAKLNPKIDPAKLTPGTLIWLSAPVTRTVPTGPYTTLGDVCEKELGNSFVWPAVWALNPAIKDPNKLPAGNVIVPADTASFSELLATLRGGTAVAVARTDTNRPTVYLDDAKRSAELADWLAGQHWDPAGRTAAVLTGLYQRDFAGQARRTYIEFLSRAYPNIVDPIFPADPRYAAHIIRRP